MFGFLQRKTKPFNSGYLPDDNGHRIFYYEFGKPDGQQVLCFHSGPGYRSHAGHAETFDLKRCRAVLFDQRGCGQSLPRGDTHHNTTVDLLNDADRLVNLLGLKRFHVYGSSWGATLALLFAQRHPDRVEKLILGKTFLARPQDADWLFDQTRLFYPDILQDIEADVPQGRSVRQHYADLMGSADPVQNVWATKRLGRYEHVVGKLDAHLSDGEPTADEIANYKLYAHYDGQDYFLGDDEILSGMTSIRHIPTLIVHNRLDMICPVEQSWLVHKALPHSKLVIVPDHGHGSELFTKTLRREVDAFLQNR